MNEDSLKLVLFRHERNNFMTSIDTTDNMHVDGTEMERLTSHEYLEKQNKKRIRIKAGWGVFGEYREIFLDMHHPISLIFFFNQRVLPIVTYDTKYGPVCTTR